MNISAKSRYALRMMIELALRHNSGFTSLGEVAATEAISIKYLEHIATALKNAGLIKVQRGARGGYILAHHPSKITVLSVIKATENEKLLAGIYTENSANSPQERCSEKAVWLALQKSIETTLSSFTLEDLKDRELKSRNSCSYEI